MPLTPEQLARVDLALYDEDPAVRQAAVSAMTTPEELHEFASHFNWDDELTELWIVVRSPHCDRGTALLLYWLTDGLFARSADDVEDFARPVWDLAMAIERRVIAGDFAHAAIPFHPSDVGPYWERCLEGASRDVPEVMRGRNPPG
jgi:hypothetical protein